MTVATAQPASRPTRRELEQDLIHGGRPRGERTPDRLDVYEGRQITIRDNRGACSHAAYCTDGLPSVWRTALEPWIDADGASKDDIVSTIRRCPSGALTYAEDGAIESDCHDEPEIRIARDGPYEVRGGIDLKDVTFGAGASHEHYVLCRCGQSLNKPFCDGSHWYAGFKDDEGRTISEANRGAVAEDAWIAVGDIYILIAAKLDLYFM